MWTSRRTSANPPYGEALRHCPLTNTHHSHTRSTTERLVSSTTSQNPPSVSSSTARSATATSRSASTSVSSTSATPDPETSSLPVSRPTPLRSAPQRRLASASTSRDCLPSQERHELSLPRTTSRRTWHRSHTRPPSRAFEHGFWRYYVDTVWKWLFAAGCYEMDESRG